jgi:hypothetical protein
MKNQTMDRKAFLNEFGKLGVCTCLCAVATGMQAALIQEETRTNYHCSVGYVKEMNELKFGRSVEVELIDSVLKGGRRCKFRITVL